MATALAIITDALTEIGVVSVGSPARPSDIALGLLRLQNQIDAWAADHLTIAVQARESFTLTAGTSTFTVGDGGDLDTQRPVWIGGVNYVVPGTSPAVEVPLGQMDNDSYMALSMKTMTSALPLQFYYNATTPLGTMFLWPTVTQDVALYLYLDQAVSRPATTASELIGPPGYQEAFMYQLALRLCGPLGRPTPDYLPARAVEAFARMKRPNLQPGLLGVDQALVPSFGGGYNVLTDSYSGGSGPR